MPTPSDGHARAPAMTLKERVFYGLVCNERRVYRHWYTRFLLAGVDFARIMRVVGRIRAWSNWCAEWYAEGEAVERLAADAAAAGHTTTARALYHEAVACFHVGQHFFYFDDALKTRCMEKIWALYPQALALTDASIRPQRVEIPYRDTALPGYLRLQPEPGRPLIIQVNGLDNVKECEQHAIGEMLRRAGFNALVFEGPGQGEMLPRMPMIADYHTATSAVIDWVVAHHAGHVDTNRIGVIGLSMGGFLGPLSAAYDRRIACVVANGGPANLRFLTPSSNANPFLYRGFPHAAGTATLAEAVAKLRYDIETTPRLDRPLLVQHAGGDRIIPDGAGHAQIFMNWAVGEKDLQFFPNGEHVCADHFDEALPRAIDWFHRHLR